MSRRMACGNSFSRIPKSYAVPRPQKGDRRPAILRPVVPDQLVANLSFGSLAVSTNHNPADNPSRDLQVRRRPATPYPAWLSDLDRGDYASWGACYGALPCAVPSILFPCDATVKSGDAGGPGDPADGVRIGEAKDSRTAAEAQSAAAAERGRGHRRDRRSRNDIDIRGSRANADERARREEEYGAFLDWLCSFGVQRGLVARATSAALSQLCLSSSCKRSSALEFR